MSADHAPVPPFPFFVGCPRSGTTLVRAIFNAHPLLAIPAESHFIPKMVAGIGRSHWAAGGPQAFADQLLADDHFRLWGLSEAAVRRALTVGTPRSVPDALRLVYRTYADREGKPRYADKTPGYVREMPLLAGLFPEARFVHVIRDGRDVSLSLMEAGWAVAQAPRGLSTMAEFWRRNVESALGAQPLLGSRYHELRYEDLVADPESVVRETCSFLELSFEPAMLAHHLQADEIASTVQDPQDHRRLAEPITSSSRDWRADMSPAELETFMEIAGDTLARAGYPSPSRCA